MSIRSSNAAYVHRREPGVMVILLLLAAIIGAASLVLSQGVHSQAPWLRLADVERAIARRFVPPRLPIPERRVAPVAQSASPDQRPTP